MAIREIILSIVEVGVMLVVFSFVLGAVLGQPIFLSYVTSGSMQPTIDTGDGFVAVPSAVAGPITEGDVVVFRAEEVNDGKLTTHRVVGETERGLITKGDNSQFTDQANDEPPVKRTQIVAVAWQPGGAVLAIPGVGLLVSGSQSVLTSIQRQLATILGTGSVLGIQGLAYLLVALSFLAYAADLVWRNGKKERTRETSRNPGTNARLVVAVFAGALVLAATVTMVAPSGPQEFGVVSAEFDSSGIRVIETGTTESATYTLGNGGMIPMVTYFEPTTDRIDIRPREVVIPGQSAVNATLTLSAPPETGYYRQYVVEHRYLLLLPQSTIRSLYEVHPWLPILAIDALLGIPFYLTGVFLMGTGRFRSRSRDGPSRFERLQSRLRYSESDNRRQRNAD